MGTTLLRKLLADQCFSLFGSGGVRVEAYALQIKAIGGVAIAVKEKDYLDVANITFGTSTSALLKAARG